MALLAATRTSQDVLCAEFIFKFNDTAVDSVTGASKTFGSVYTDALILDAINLPVGAEILGGHLVVEDQGAGPTAYTVKLGTAASDAIYLAASDLKAADNTRYALLLTSALGSADGSPIRLTIASTAANATAGKFRITVLYKKDGRGGREVNPA
jgi:hypothetical protein